MIETKIRDIKASSSVLSYSAESRNASGKEIIREIQESNFGN